MTGKFHLYKLLFKTSSYSRVIQAFLAPALRRIHLFYSFTVKVIIYNFLAI